MDAAADDIRQLQDALEATHGDVAAYVQTHLVKELFRGEEAWEAGVAEFSGDNRRTIYAFRMPGGEIAVVLKEPPVGSPADAVRAALAASNPE